MNDSGLMRLFLCQSASQPPGRAIDSENMKEQTVKESHAESHEQMNKSFLGTSHACGLEFLETSFVPWGNTQSKEMYSKCYVVLVPAA